MIILVREQVRTWVRIVLAALVLSCAGPVMAVQPDEVLPDPALETRARDISRELRCMVCQNQSIDDSDAPLARDLRLLVRERLQGGDSDGQGIDFLVARYGEFVLLRPRFTTRTALLWLLPSTLLVIGIAGLILLGRRYRMRTAQSSEAASVPGLSPAEEARLADVMNRRDG
jgi:cytochrome c-type biogenesis protein CcmH